LAALGALGTWIRATGLESGIGVPTQVASVAGRSQSTGWVLFALGLAAAVGAMAWLNRRPAVRAVAAGASLLLVVLAAIRLAAIDGRAAEMAEEAIATAGVDTYHAAFGWGAWLLLLGVMLLSLGILAGGLRELDLRRTG
jgi:hypothetical protein